MFIAHVCRNDVFGFCQGFEKLCNFSNKKNFSFGRTHTYLFTFANKEVVSVRFRVISLRNTEYILKAYTLLHSKFLKCSLLLKLRKKLFGELEQRTRCIIKQMTRGCSGSRAVRAVMQRYNNFSTKINVLQFKLRGVA